MTIDLYAMTINKAKFMADGNKYFELYRKHIPGNISGNILLLSINNLDCISKIMSMNPNAKYLIIDRKTIIKSLSIVCKDMYDIEAIENDDEDLYNIIQELDMKFDCIIMNPPYQKNLHLKILAEAIKHLKDDNSVCVNLSPITWAGKHNICQPKGEWRKKLNGKINSLDFIEHRNANDIFGTGNAIEDLAITTYKNNGTFDIINYGFTSQLEASLFKKINIFRKDGTIFTLSQATGKSVYGSGNGKNVIRKKYDVPIYTWHGGKTCGEAVLNTKVSDVEKCAATFRFNSENERINFINSLDTTFMNWYYKMFIVPGDYKLAAYMFRMADYTQPWTDERFYKFFNITPAEQKVIEETMEKYK